MRRWFRIALAVVVVASVLAAVVWQVWPEPEPVYQGKSLRAWILQYNYAQKEGEKTRGQEAQDAVRHIGTNAIPTLLKMLSKKDSAAESKLVGLWNRHLHSVPYSIRYPDWYENQAANLNSMAAQGFEILGADAQQAAAALIRIYERNISPTSQYATGTALNGIGPAAQRMAIPSYLRGAASSNATVREVAVWSLFGVHTEPQLVVPALVRALGDTNWVIRLVAARGLGNFGTNAQQAVPALVILLSDPNMRVRPNATNALKAIDPEVAAKAGVK